MAARTKARKRALDVLFEADQRRANVAQVLDDRIGEPGTEAPLPPYAVEIVRGVLDHWHDINELISDAADGWEIKRLAGVDRALLRVAIWEIAWNDEVPTAVAIDEAVELAADLSTEESPRFINGVLSTVARRVSAPATEAAERPLE